MMLKWQYGSWPLIETDAGKFERGVQFTSSSIGTGRSKRALNISHLVVADWSHIYQYRLGESWCT